MTPKEKAEDLWLSYYQLLPDGVYSDYAAKEEARKFALIAVDEIIKSEPRYPSNVDWDDVGGTHKYYYEAQREEALIYWKEVKQEIEKL